MSSYRSFMESKHRLFCLHIIKCLLLLPLMLLSADTGQALGQETELRLSQGTTLSIPIVLSQPTKIESFDGQISGYDATVLELTDVTLMRGILEASDYVLENDIIDDTIYLVAYARGSFGDFVTGSGHIMFVTFNLKTEGSTVLSFTKFECNESSVAGGFYVNGAIVQSFAISVNHPPVAEDVTLETNEDRPLNGTLPATDEDQDALAFTILTDPANGTLEVTDSATGEFIYTPDANMNGTDTFVYQASDGIDDSDIATITIDIHPVNDTPTFTSTAVTTATEDETYTYAVATGDIDANDSRTVTAPTLPDWLTLTGNEDGTATLSGAPGNENVGEHPVDLQVMDAAGAAITQSFTITVTNINDPPNFASTPNTDTLEDEIYTYTVSTTDIDAGDTRAVTGQILPEWLALTDNGDGTAVLGGTPGNEHVGEHLVELRVADAADADDVQNFTLSVANVNDAPMFDDDGITDATQDHVYACGVVTTDIDAGDTRAVTGQILPEWLALTDNGDGTAVLNGTPGNEHVGEHHVTLEVKDAANATDTLMFTITVANVNDAPTFTSEEITNATEDEAYTYTVATDDVDTNDTRILTAPTLPDWLEFNDNGDGTGTIRGTPTNSHVGDHDVVLQAKDAAAATGIQSFTIHVTNTNDAPSFTSTEITAALEDEAYHYPITTFDPDVGDMRTITALEKPDWLLLGNNGDGTATLEGTPGNEHVGDHNVVLQVKDAAGITDTQSFTIHVANTNDAPIFSSQAMIAATEDEAYAYAIISADADAGDTRILTAPILPDWLEFNDNGDGTGMIRGTPANSHVGDHDVMLLVRDAAGAADTQSFTIRVANTNDAPRFASAPLTNAAEDTPYIYRVITEEPDAGDTRTLISAALPAWLDLTDNEDGTATLQGTPANNEVGDHNVALQVRDAAGATASQSFTITVENINDAPRLNDSGAMALNTINEDEAELANIGTLVSDIIAGSKTHDPITDPDANALEGIAVISADRASGVWQYDDNRDGMFTEFPEYLSQDHALLLTDMTTIRFVPDPDFDGTAEITFRAWDQTSGESGDIDADTTSNGGTSAFSTDTANAFITIVPINDAPVITGQQFLSVPEDTPLAIVLAHVDAEDPDNMFPEGFTLTVRDGENYVRDGNTVTPAGNFAGELAVPVTVSDGTSESAVFILGVTVTSVNDAPVITGQQFLSVPEDTSLVLVPDHLEAEDPDSMFPDDFELMVLDGENYAHEENTIIPGENFTGELTVPVTVSDGMAESNIFMLTITVSEVNDVPVITGQNLLNATQGTGLSLFLSDLEIQDPDNTFPDDFELTIPDGENYVREENTITPLPDFSGTLSIPVTVSDGTDESDPFLVSITVGESEKAVVITGQKPLSTLENTSLTIILSDLKVEDPDDVFPTDFILMTEDGEHYDREHGTITPNPGFIGTLTVPIRVSRENAESNLFDLQIRVIPDTEETRTIRGTITGLEKGRDIRINVVSRSLEFGQVIDVKGTGEAVDYNFAELAPATDYNVELNSPDHAYQAYDGKADLDIADFVDLSENDADNIDFALSPPDAVISGTIIFPDDASPGDRAQVTVFSPSTGATGETEVEFQGDPEILYEITGLFPADDYTVSIWPDKYKNRYYDGTEAGTKSEEDAKLVDTNTPEAESISFRLEKGISVSGGIVGDAVEGSTQEDADELYVEIWDASTGSAKSGTILPDGTLVVEGLEETSEFYIVVHKPGVAPFFYGEEGTVRDISLATTIRAQDGIPEDISIEANEGETIAGTVLDENGDPVAGVWMEAWSESQGTESQGTGYGGAYTQEDGTYEIMGVPLDEVSAVIARPDNALPYAIEENTIRTSQDVGGTDIQLSSRDAYKMEGSVKNEIGSLIPNVEVEVSSESQNFHDQYAPGPETQGLYIAAPYSISGLPRADDYVITARPPSDSGYAVLTETNVSVHGDTVRDIILERGTEIKGDIDAGDGEDVKGVRVILVSEEKNFRAEVMTDEKGSYEITNVPEASDYEITIVSESFTSQEKAVDIISQTDGNINVDIITLEPGGGISGQARDKITESPLPGILVEIRSESMGDLPNYGGIAVTDEQGLYAVEGLQKKDGDGNLVGDYVVTVNAEDYPLHMQTGKVPGHETVDFLLDPGEPLSGTVSGYGDGADMILTEVFEKDGDFVKSVISDPDGIFNTGGLSFERQYELRFTAFLKNSGEMTQWAGQGDIGFDDPDPDSGRNPDEAKVFNAGDTVGFRFGENAGRARNAELETRSSRSEKALDLSSADSGIVSASPQVTVKWESSSEDPYEKYYYVFNRDSGHVMTKRNAPPVRPVTIRRATSQELTGDNVAYYFHVAPVNQRGRIGTTESIGFRIDTVPPANAVVTAPRFTTSQYVSLTIGATGAFEMLISNSNYGEGGTWEELTQSKEWKLTQGEGIKKIYVQFRDRAGNTANALAVTEKLTSIPDQHKITATAGENGSIIPLGDVLVWSGDDRTFVIAPDEGYQVGEVIADGEVVMLTHGSTYVFRNVTRDASISATFEAKATVTYTITASAGPNGMISPSGNITVPEGDDMTFTVTPDEGYEPDMVLVDGKRVRLRPDNTYKFINVGKDYTLSVTFKLKL